MKSYKPSKKVFPAFSLQKKLKVCRKAGKKVVFTNGCFDLLHIGHIRYLQKARSLGDILVIGVNKDASVRAIKGPDRPVTNEKERAEILAALDCVDYVTLFGEATPEKLIRLLRPDVLVKGGDWKIKDIVGGEFVSSRGGKVLSLPFVKDRSTTRVIEKLLKAS